VADCPSRLFPLELTRASKLVMLGSRAELPSAELSVFRSLHIEHVSPSALVSREICRRSPLGQSAELAMQRGTPVPAETLVALMRRWFMARKPDAGFCLYGGFPATLLQARILAEWLDARDETLDAVVASDFASGQSELAEYYRLHGLLLVLPEGAASAETASRL
jgi:adenylate kinase